MVCRFAIDNVLWMYVYAFGEINITSGDHNYCKLNSLNIQIVRHTELLLSASSICSRSEQGWPPAKPAQLACGSDVHLFSSRLILETDVLFFKSKLQIRSPRWWEIWMHGHIGCSELTTSVSKMYKRGTTRKNGSHFRQERCLPPTRQWSASTSYVLNTVRACLHVGIYGFFMKRLFLGRA